MDLPVNGVYVDIFEDGKKIEYTIGQPDSIKKYREDEVFKLRDVCGIKYNTVFTIGDIVWFMYNDNVCSGKIKSVRYIKFISSINLRVIEMRYMALKTYLICLIIANFLRQKKI